MPLILQSHMEGGEYTLSFSHPYYSSRVDCSAMQGSGALDWLQSFGFVMVAGVVPEQHQGQQPLEEQFHLSCATANVLDTNSPLWNTDKTKARAVNSCLNTALTLREINNDILKKRHFASNSTPTFIHWGRTITIHSPRTAGPCSQRPSTSSFHPKRSPALQHLYFYHLKPTHFHFQAPQIHALMFLSSSPLPSQNNSGNCTSEICSASSAVLMPSGSSVASQPFLFSSTAPILHQLPFLSLVFFKLSSSFQPSQFILFIFSQCSSLYSPNGHLQLNLNYISYQQLFSGWWAYSRRKPKAKGLAC